MTRCWDVTSYEGTISVKISVVRLTERAIIRTFRTRTQGLGHGWMDGNHERRESCGDPSWFEDKKQFEFL